MSPSRQWCLVKSPSNKYDPLARSVQPDTYVQYITAKDELYLGHYARPTDAALRGIWTIHRNAQRDYARHL